MNAKVEHTKGCASRLRYGPHDFCACDCGASSTAGEAVAWQNFPAWLIDHAEGEAVSEEMLQRHLAAMLKATPRSASSTVGEAVEPVAFITHSATALTQMHLTDAGMMLGVGKHPCYTTPRSASSTAGEAVDWKARAEHYQREHAKLYDQLHGTPCEQLRENIDWNAIGREEHLPPPHAIGLAFLESIKGRDIGYSERRLLERANALAKENHYFDADWVKP